MDESQRRGEKKRKLEKEKEEEIGMMERRGVKSSNKDNRR